MTKRLQYRKPNSAFKMAIDKRLKVSKKEFYKDSMKFHKSGFLKPSIEKSSVHNKKNRR